MHFSELITPFTRHLVKSNYREAFKLTGIEWDVTDFNCPESEVLADSDARFEKKITEFFKDYNYLFDEYDELNKAGFTAYISQYLLEHPVRKMIVKVLGIKAITAPPPPIVVDVSHLPKEQIEKIKSDLKNITQFGNRVIPQKTNDPVEAVFLAINQLQGSESQYPMNKKDCVHFSTTLFVDGKAECFGCGAVVSEDREVVEVGCE